MVINAHTFSILTPCAGWLYVWCPRTILSTFDGVRDMGRPIVFLYLSMTLGYSIRTDSHPQSAFSSK